ncbi:hypothetical protein [Labedaea rhizosphaerae]|uniref:Uncharacterized protein n=1 Tax=Labedaea rhizosphaerae TaxID=598644 RepID=A0A4R6SNE8_LABRH|nr:hypothetical protein [Labedaea rhizosphaerae]TDQ04922.1 hypothetical protein EV186_101883 [Labedaea rhizosphaerae]
MSHHVTATATNPSGAVEVVHVASAAAASAPLDLGSTGSGGLVKTSATQVEGESKMRGANLPTDNIEAASNTIQRGKADLAATAGAETRLNVLDLVGGGGGGGGGGAAAGQQNANNATGAVAQNNPDVDQLKTQTNLNAPTVNDLPSGGTTPLGQAGSGLPQQDVRSVKP